MSCGDAYIISKVTGVKYNIRTLFQSSSIVILLLLNRGTVVIIIVTFHSSFTIPLSGTLFLYYFQYTLFYQHAQKLSNMKSSILCLIFVTTSIALPQPSTKPPRLPTIHGNFPFIFPSTPSDPPNSPSPPPRQSNPPHHRRWPTRYLRPKLRRRRRRRRSTIPI